MKIVANNLEYIEKTYLTQIEYNSNIYFFRVKTLEIHYRKDIINPIQINIERANTIHDCRNKLKKYEKKKMKKIIEDLIHGKK